MCGFALVRAPIISGPEHAPTEAATFIPACATAHHSHQSPELTLLGTFGCGLTGSPFPWQYLAWDAVRQRDGSKTKSNQDLGDNEPVNAAGTGCNGRTDKRYYSRADEEGLPGLESVGRGGDEWRNYGLNE